MLPSLQDYLTIKEAAGLVGVSPKTLRAWDRAGKLRPVRHPLNRYRLYLREDLEAFLRRLAAARAEVARAEGASRPPARGRHRPATREP